MKKKGNNQEIDDFISALIRSYSDSLKQELPSSSPFFMARLHLRIREKQSLPHFWETGVIKAQRWLVGFSLIALFFFVSNIVLDRPSSIAPDDATPEALALGEHEWDHFYDYAPQAREVGKP